MSSTESASGTGSTAVIDGVDVDAVAAAVRACPGVDDLYSTSATVVSSYLPRRQVGGVRVRPDAVLVQIRSRWGQPATLVGAQIRAAVAGLVGDRDIDVVIADVTDPPPDGDTEVVWTKTSDESAASSSAPITPTAAGMPPNS